MARIRRDPRSQLVTIIVVVVLILLGWWSEPYLSTNDGPTNDVPPRSSGVLENGEYEVARVVDGDTLILRQDRLRVRLQGVDTPETVKDNTPIEKWGPEAAAFTESFVRDANHRIAITIDGEGIDQYGRHLAFVWHDRRLLNEELIARGLARAKLGYDYSQQMKDRLRRAENRARRAGIGIWSE